MNKFLILLAVLTISCGNTVSKSNSDNELNIEDESTNFQDDMLLGEFHKEDLQQKPFSSWFKPRYSDFSPQTEAMETIKENIEDYEIKVLMGTWCGDSKREIPKLLKILDNSDFNYKNIEMIAVDYNKTTPSKIEEELNVHRVPTIIFYKDGKEANRFVEYTQEETLEEDIAKIVSGETYKNSYAD
ncbi:TlpA family protein disulfide reductase [Christiangramia echinicola]|uniref:Thiol-disulfide isomerase or thioredoxin n=1 Tax=Christiangramia echinicola TaxID=279359 RepID=A0A1H1LED8_9FLAO|nr:thioredoxin family protein [Christiangramia echinicola]SDR72944.1 Thiol-disulfide isomerase or thioredoxin [Christiangramia echinicola]